MVVCVARLVVVVDGVDEIFGDDGCDWLLSWLQAYCVCGGEWLDQQITNYQCNQVLLKILCPATIKVL